MPTRKKKLKRKPLFRRIGQAEEEFELTATSKGSTPRRRDILLAARRKRED